MGASLLHPSLAGANDYYDFIHKRQQDKVASLTAHRGSGTSLTVNLFASGLFHLEPGEPKRLWNVSVRLHGTRLLLLRCL